MKKSILWMLLLLPVATWAQNGFCLEYSVAAPMNMSGLVKMHLWNKHSRTEMSMNGGPMGGIVIAILNRSDMPGKVSMINDKQKSYSEMDAATQAGPNGNKECQVTVLGREKMGTYNSTHVKVVQGSETYDMWVSADKPEFTKYAWGSGGFANEKIYKALQAKGVKGYPVKLVHKDKEGATTLTLTKAEAKSYTDANFRVPAGYKKSAAGGMPEGAGKQLTPEQQKMMEEYMKQQKH